MNYRGSDDTEKKKIFYEKTEWTGICNECFCEDKECKCGNKERIYVDKNIARVLREFHLKNYQTVSCCEGHYVYKENEGKLEASRSPMYITLDRYSGEDLSKEFLLDSWWQNNNYELIKIEKTGCYDLRKYFKLQKKTSIERLGLMKQAQIEELIEHIQKMQSRLYRQCEKRIKTNY